MKIKLNKSIYSSSGVKRAIKDYADLCEIRLSKTKEYHELLFLGVNSPVDEELVDEFVNYALHTTIQGKKKC